jgi:hypothetical protein
MSDSRICTVVSNTEAENFAFIQCVDDETGLIMPVDKNGNLALQVRAKDLWR